MTATTSYRKYRYRQFLWLFIQKFQPSCPICGELFKESDVPNSGQDLLTEHHLDGVHSNNALLNRVLVHRYCHKKYHLKDNIHKQHTTRKCPSCGLLSSGIRCSYCNHWFI